MRGVVVELAYLARARRRSSTDQAVVDGARASGAVESGVTAGQVEEWDVRGVRHSARLLDDVGAKHPFRSGSERHHRRRNGRASADGARGQNSAEIAELPIERGDRQAVWVRRGG